MNIKDIFLAVLVALIWGSYFSASKIALDSFPPMFFIALRFLFLFILTSAYLFKDVLPLKTVIIFSLIFAFNMLAINKAIDLCDDLAPIILISELAVPLSILFGLVFLKEKFAFKDWLGMILAFIGLAIVIHTRSEERVQGAAVALALAASIFFALYNLASKKLASYNIKTVISLSSLFLFPVFFILSFFYEQWPAIEEIQLKSVMALLYIVIIGSAMALFIWMSLLKIYPMSKVVPFSLLTPVFGCIINTIMFNEAIEINTLLGGLLIITGLMIIELKRKYVKKEF